MHTLTFICDCKRVQDDGRAAMEIDGHTTDRRHTGASGSGRQGRERGGGRELVQGTGREMQRGMQNAERGGRDMQRGAMQMQRGRGDMRRGGGRGRVVLDWQKPGFVPDHVKHPER